MGLLENNRSKSIYGLPPDILASFASTFVLNPPTNLILPTTRCPPPLILASGISSCSSLTIWGIFISTPRLRSTAKSGPYPSVTIALSGYLWHSRSCTSPLVLPGGGNVMIRTWCHYILLSHRQQFPGKKVNINQLKMTKICHEIKIQY